MTNLHMGKLSQHNVTLGIGEVGDWDREIEKGQMNFLITAKLKPKYTLLLFSLLANNRKPLLVYLLQKQRTMMVIKHSKVGWS